MALLDTPAWSTERSLTLSPAGVRTLASVTLTIAGTNAATDISTVTFTGSLFTNLYGQAIVITSTAKTGQTTAALEAAQICSDINNSGALARVGIFATRAAAIITINQPGPVGNLTTVTFTAVAGSQTGTFGNAGVLAGGTGPAIVMAATTATPASTLVQQAFTERELYVPAVATDLSGLLTGGMVAM